MKYTELHELATKCGMRLGLTVRRKKGSSPPVSEPDMILVYRKGDPDEVVYKAEFYSFDGSGMENPCERVATWIRSQPVA